MRVREILSIVKAHLLKQNCKSTDNTGRCRYRGPDGMQCAAGCLIPDSLYLETMEGKMFNSKEFKEVAAFHGWTAKECDFVRKLQRIHDGVAVREWEAKLCELEGAV